MARTPWTINDLPQAIRDDPRNRAALGLEHVPPPTPEKSPAPPIDLLRLEGQLLTRIRRLARQEGWQGLHTYNALGDDHGLHIILVRDAIIFADVKAPGTPLTASQERWRDALLQVGTPQIETYVWDQTSWPQIAARLTRPRTHGKADR